MLILKPKIHSTIWGGNALRKMYPSVENIGHLYSCVPGGEYDSEIVYPKELEGKTFGWFLDEQPEYKEAFPFVTAIVTPQSDLSIQVHPPFGAKNGKNESWFFLAAPNEGYIYGGCTAPNKKVLSESIKDGSLMKYVKKVHITKGDYVSIKGGTLHSMTAGSIVYEIEELGGKTCRLFDYKRRDSEGNLRPLQVYEGLQFLNIGQCVSVQKASNDVRYEKKYTSQHFSVGYIYCNNKDWPVCLTILGELELKGIHLGYGTSIILFANEKIDTRECEFIVVSCLKND